MAVHAQYPSSNLLLLNRNVVEDGKPPQLGNDYLLEGSSSRFLDQPSSQMLFGNLGGSGTNINQRKRGREVSTSSTKLPMNLQQSQFLQLSDVRNQQHPNAVFTGLRLASNEQQQQHKLQQYMQQQQSKQTSLSPQSSMLLTEDLSSQIKQQRDEIEHFIHAQGEELRRTLAEKRQRHCYALLGAAEESVSRRIREKEAELQKAARRNAELEARATQLSMEAQVWQARAKAQEATVTSLQTQLQHAIMSRGCGQNNSEVEVLECTGGEPEDAESAYIDPDRVEVIGPGCKSCGKRVASVVVLPCRHLCICTECDGVVQTCPLCLSFRSSSIEVLLT